MDVRRIWDQAPHNAFTDLALFQGRWFCAFREGQSHVSDDGRLRVIASEDGESWSPVALMEWSGGDVRDAKLSVTADGMLMLNGAVRFLEPADGNRHQSVTWLSPDGNTWSEPYACPSGLGTWRWSATWHKDAGYSFGYSGKDDRGTLYRTTDGKRWSPLAENVFPEGYANESSIAFAPDDTAFCLLRRDPRRHGADTALLGRSSPPYTQWDWSELGVRLGGPKLMRMDDGRLLAVVRLYDRPVRTSLCEIDERTGSLTELYALPSGGDTSYAGMVTHANRLWVSYYSSHEEKTAIYLARLPIPDAPPRVAHIGSRLELLAHPELVASMQGASLRLHRPEPREVALVCDRPWETGGPGYATVLQDGDTCRMYYRATPSGKGSDADPSQVTCYAESRDGIQWSKPELGLFAFEDSKRNNIVWQGPISHNMSVFIDPNPVCPPDQRYKAVGGVKWKHDGLWALVSPDGIHWRKLGDRPMPLTGKFDSHNLVFWDAHRGEYRAYWRDGRRADPRVPNGRDIRTATSPDFLTWSEPVWLDYRPNRSGSNERDSGDDPSGDHHQLYTNNVLPYPRAPHLLLGFPARYSDRGWTRSIEALPNRDERRKLADLGIGGGLPTRTGTALWDTLFMTSRDGAVFRVWPEAFVRPGIQRPGSWFYGQAGCAWGMLETASLYAGAPPELSFYVKDNARVEPPYRLRRHALRLDGFASVYAPLPGGTVAFRPLRFDGNRLEINFSTSAGGRLRAELRDEDGRPLPGFTFDDCDLQYGDQHDRCVSWRGSADVSACAGRTVQLRFELKDADLYAFAFRGR